MKSLARQKRTRRCEDSGQRRVRVLICVLAGAEVLHARAQVSGLIHRVAENGVGGRDPQGADQNENDRQQNMPAVNLFWARKGLQAPLYRATRTRTEVARTFVQGLKAAGSTITGPELLEPFSCPFSSRGTAAETSRRVNRTPRVRSMWAISLRSWRVPKVEAVPRAPMRPVRPTRWMKSSGTCGKS